MRGGDEGDGGSGKNSEKSLVGLSACKQYSTEMALCPFVDDYYAEREYVHKDSYWGIGGDSSLSSLYKITPS